MDAALFERSGGSSSHDDRPSYYKVIGISLAVASGLFIGVSFVLKKLGLLKANVKYKEEAGEGYGYLKNTWWWSGMSLMIVGEICNFVAYAFTDAILVTPLGALSVVITTILSAIFLKERLSMVGKVSCFLCIIGSVVIVMNAPQTSSVKNIQEMQHYVIAPGFLSYAGVILVGSVITAFWAGPKWGKKNMLVYISICSWVGGLSVVATQGLGSAIIAWINGDPQYKHWFLWVLFVFVIGTLLTEIIFLNKALNIYNAALVTPTYYVYFTSTTIITSCILFQGFKGTPTSIVTVVLGFLTICSGVVLLQLSKSAKDVPDAAVFQGDLNQIQTIAEQEQPESEPKADAIRGTAAIMRQISQRRLRMEAEELKRLHEEKKMMETMEPISENGQPVYEWDGLRRRQTMTARTSSTRSRTVTSPPPTSSSPYHPVSGSDAIPPLPRTPTVHPPLGMSRFPDYDEEYEETDHTDRSTIFSSIVGTIRGRTRTQTHETDGSVRSPMPPVPLTEFPAASHARDGHDGEHGFYDRPRQDTLHSQDTRYRGASGGSGHSPAPTPPPHSSARRRFSFHNPFRRSPAPLEPTDEERMGLVKDDETEGHAVRPRNDGAVDDDEKCSEGSDERPYDEHYDTPYHRHADRYDDRDDRSDQGDRGRRDNAPAFL